MSKRPPKGMSGPPPSARGGRPADAGLHASEIAREWEDVGEGYVRRRMKELGIPNHQIGQPDYGGDGRGGALDPFQRQGGKKTTGAGVEFGGLEPRMVQGEKGGRHWAKVARQDRNHPDL